MDQACTDALLFTDSLTDEIPAEYLLTVHVAMNINALNRDVAEAFEIRIEDSTQKFATECVPLLRKVPASNFLGHTHILRQRLDTLRRGRIDVAVYLRRNGDRLPLCAIELKGFNPSRTVVLKDLKRNSEYFALTGATGSSRMGFAVFGALHSIYSPKKLAEDRNLSNLKDKYKRWLAEVGLKDFYSSTVEVFTVRRHVADAETDVAGHSDFGDEDNHHYAGVLVIFLPQSPSSVS
jgi:hypothetical protein